MNEKPGLEMVSKFLAEHNGRGDGLTAKKFDERAKQIEDPERPDCVVFEVERHHSILGSFYRPGNAMESFVTYWSRYAFNPKTKTLVSLPEQRARTITADWDALSKSDSNEVSFSFQCLGNGKHICRERAFNEEWRVVQFEDVERHIEELADGLEFREIAEALAEEAGNGRGQEFEEKFRAAFRARALSDARQEWMEYMKDPIGNSEED